MSVEENKVLGAGILEEVWGQGKLEVADEILSPDYVDHIVEGPEAQTVRDPDALKRAAAMFRGAFPDLHYTVEDIVAEGDKVVAASLRAGPTGAGFCAPRRRAGGSSTPAST